ncbi:MAG: hypothetical protein JWM56_1051 [Candidatus Peribacteria bacterium]|nr:hypothetical protein [Candidatus Peribacteria bacterium]
MISQPFALFEPFQDRLETCILSKADAIQADADILKALQIENLASLHQIHGNTAVFVRAPTSRTLQADGLMTDAKNLTLTIRAADCQNFVVYAPGKNIIGLIHAGWRGLIAGIIPSYFQKLKDECGVEIEDTFIGAGPSLCQNCAEFSDPATELPGIPEKFINGRTADLRAFATYQLIAFGMNPEQFERYQACPRCDPKTWWTYRGGDREDVMKGRTNVLACRLV